MKKRIVVFLSAAVLALCASAEVTVTDVIAKQRYPWNGLVDITCNVSGIYGPRNGQYFYGEAVMPDSGRVRRMQQFWVVQNGTNSTDQVVSSNGRYRLLWDASADLARWGYALRQLAYDDMVIRITVRSTHQEKVQLWEGGPYWAKTNIGAKKPDDCGYYFWWGDTIGYKRVNNVWVASDGSSSNFSFSHSNTPTYGKNIATLKSEGWITTEEVLAPEHDAALVHWGGRWRIPTKQELSDLKSKCSWTWTITNSVSGYIVKGEGAYASASIFLPGAGYDDGTSFHSAAVDEDAGIVYSTSCDYWSSVPRDSFSAWRFEYCSLDIRERAYGLPIRPVQGITAGYTGDSAPFRLDTVATLTPPMVDSISISWDASWVGGDVNATVVIEDNGAEVMRTIGEGEFTHELTGVGRHDLTYTTYIDGVAQDEIYSATVFKDWRYEVKAGGAVIVETSQMTGAITIPATIDGHPVTGIAAGVFAGCTNLTSVTIPASVWHVGHGVFKDCTGLRRVEAVKGQKWMLESQNAFVGCSPELEIVYASTAEVRDVVAKQRFPWNGKVDITYTLTGDMSVGLPESHIIALRVMATNRVDGTFYVATPDALSGDTGTEQGTHHVVWNLGAQGIEFKSDDVVFTVTYAIPQYCVIDLSAGADAAQYPVTYMMVPPSGGFNADEYKTTKLVLRLINPGTLMMRNQYDVMLTKPFYCGIFEVTQKQYELVTGGNPSSNYLKGDMRPVVDVSWNTIRGNSRTYNWPTFAHVDSSKFVGKLQTRTGLNFDLPTEAQWEYACRAGTTSSYNNGGNTETDLKLLGRYVDNWFDCPGSEAFCTTVGSYFPNAWGLYDMHGNVCEWCLDWYGSLSVGLTDPVGSSSGTSRVLRGGSYHDNEYECTSYKCADKAPSYGDETYDNTYGGGFRLVRTLSKLENEQKLVAVAGVERDDVLCAGDSASIVVNSCIEPLVDAIAIPWDAAWIGGKTNATVVVTDNGIEVKRATGAGEFVHAFSSVGRHELSYTTYIGGVAQDEAYTATVYAKWKYDVKDGGAVMAETTQTAGAITIPSTIDGHPVTGIAEGAFANCSELTSVKIPASVWDVGYAAFGHCTGLQHVEAARGLRGMLESRAAFAWCSPELQIDYFTTAEIRNVVAKQRFPWNGKVDITYEISGDLTAGCPAWRLPSFLVFATNRLEDTLYVSVADALSGDIGTTAGVHHVTWDMASQGIEFKSDDVVFSVVYGDEAALYEKWTTPSTVTFDRQGGSGGSWAVTARHGSAMPSITVPTRSGYSFGGYWSGMNGSGVQFYTASGTSARTWGNFGAMTLYAKWTGNAYVVTLDQQSGSGGTTNMTATYGSAMPSVTVPMRAGFMFMGYWSEPNGEGTQYYSESGTSVRTWDKTSATSLYAKWAEAEKYTVTLDQQGGSGGTFSVMAMYSNPMPFIAVPTRSGYVFDGYWSGTNGSGTQYYTPSGTSAHVWDKANATTLYAKWVEQ